LNFLISFNVLNNESYRDIKLVSGMRCNIIEEAGHEALSDQRQVLTTAALLDVSFLAEIKELLPDECGVAQSSETNVVLLAENLFKVQRPN